MAGQSGEANERRDCRLQHLLSVSRFSHRAKEVRVRGEDREIAGKSKEMGCQLILLLPFAHESMTRNLHAAVLYRPERE